MLSILTSPILRKLLTAIITIGIGFSIGYSLRNDQIKSLRKDKNFAKGQFQQLTSSYEQLQTVTDTLQNTIIHLAVQERIQTTNYISDTKVKDGSTLSFVPKTRANLSVVKTNIIDVIPLVSVPTITNNKQQLPTPKEKEKQSSWWRRNFGRKHKITKQ